MINLFIKKKIKNTSLIYHFYNDINRIPLEIIFDDNSKYRKGINIDNYNEVSGDFITFKFDIETKILCNITFVSINEKNIVNERIIRNIKTIEGYHDFYVNNINDEHNMRMNHETKLIFDSDNNSVLICFNNIDFKKNNFYSVDERLYLGINFNNDLSSILLRNLKIGEIEQFLNL